MKMDDYNEIRSRTGLVFRLHPLLGGAFGCLIHDEDTDVMRFAAFPSDIADFDPEGAVAVAQKAGWTQGPDGAWWDPILVKDGTMTSHIEATERK